MGNFQRILMMTIIALLALFTLTSGQKESYVKAKGSKSSSINSVLSDDRTKQAQSVTSLIPGYQNSSLPFNVRFGKPPRVSQRFHYPVLPDVYWTQHKRPFVPLVDEEQK